jgi:hypothetical protein
MIWFSDFVIFTIKKEANHINLTTMVLVKANFKLFS